MKNIFLNLKRALLFLAMILNFLCFNFFLQATPDLTIVGYIMPDDGLGKIPINIIETLDDDISINIIITHDFPSHLMEPKKVVDAIANPDKSDGRVALFTEGLWHVRGVPSDSVPQNSIVKIAYSMFETTEIPSPWVRILNEKFDAVVVPDKFYVQVYQDCGVNIPIFVLPIPMRLDAYYKHKIHIRDSSKPFVFGDASANKNPAVLVKAFAQAFGNNPSVKLVMRANVILPRTEDAINRVISEFGLTNVSIERGSLALKEFINKIASFDCYINLSKGEGFSFIPREALALGVPVIVTDNTASKTICKSGFVTAVPSLLRVPPIPNYMDLFNEPCGEQFDCDVADVVVALRDVYENYEKHLQKAQEGRQWVDQYFCRNKNLRKLYRTLVKPKMVILGKTNKIGIDVIITTSSILQEKYQKIINNNK